MIYFVQATDGGPVKIGATENFELRLADLQAHYDRPLAILATMPGGRDEERVIQRQFAHLRIGRSEQFRPAADLMQFIGRPLLASADAVAPMPISKRRKPNGLNVRATPEWLAWLREAAEHCGMSVSTMVDQGVRLVAKRGGFDKPAPKR